MVLGIGPGFYYFPFSVYLVRTYLAVVVDLTEFCLAQLNKLKETMPSNQILRKHKHSYCFTEIVRRIY